MRCFMFVFSSLNYILGELVCLLEELREKETMGMSEACWPQKRNNVCIQKKIKIKIK